MLNNTSTYFSDKRFTKIIWIIMIISIIGKFYLSIKDNLIFLNLNSYGYTEFLINFSGGFVRRGLVGEILYHITASTGIAPQWIIIPICMIAYAFTIYFFLWAFNRKGYNKWIVLSPLMCGMVVYIIRKDFILYAILIAMFTLVKDTDPKLWKRTVSFILAILALFLHEAFLFWGLPLYFLVLLNDKKYLVVNRLFILCILISAGVMFVFKGDAAIADTIIGSWNNVLPNHPLEYGCENSIDALSWETIPTFIFHMKNNLGFNYIGLFCWPIIYLAVYYLITFFFTIFKPAVAIYGENERTALSAIFFAVSVCLLPMFALLSCDYGRLFQYATITSFAAFIILSPQVSISLFPKLYINKITQINTLISRFLPPSKGLLIILLLIIGISPAWFSLNNSVIQSPFGSVGIVLILILCKIYSFLIL